jgi:hypothetical protein
VLLGLLAIALPRHAVGLLDGDGLERLSRGSYHAGGPRADERRIDVDFQYEYPDRWMTKIWEPVGYVPNMTYDTHVPPQQPAEAVQADEPVVVQTDEEPTG